jgi:hypothetical protein
MNTPAAAVDQAPLEAALAAVEGCLASLGDALRARDTGTIDMHAAELHRALASAVEQFAQAARTGRVAPALRDRLAAASGRVAAQRESLARATAALDRAIDILLPAPKAGGGLYSADGGSERSHRGGPISA